MKRNVRFTAWYPNGQARFFANCEIHDPAVLEARGKDRQVYRLYLNDSQSDYAVACPRFFVSEADAQAWFKAMRGVRWAQKVVRLDNGDVAFSEDPDEVQPK